MIYFFNLQNIYRKYLMKRNVRIIYAILLILLTSISSCSLLSFNGNDEQQSKVKIETNYGTIVLALYNETPLHRDNFIKLTKSKFYDSLLFHRVIPNFMIQCGDPGSKGASQTKFLGNGGPGYTIPAEFMPGLIHKKGAVAAARLGEEQNPLKASSGSQFYIVQGRIYSEQELNQIEEQRISKMTIQVLIDYLQKPEQTELRNQIIALQKEGKTEEYNAKIEEIKALFPQEMAMIERFKYTPEQRKIYTTLGGTPHLDYEYTVFGEVIEGFDIVEKISNVETHFDRPKINVVMKVSMKK